MTIIFFGSDDFAATSLMQLLANKHQVLACVTQPDRRQGRGMQVVISPIKELAQTHQIPCLQPNNLKDSQVVTQLELYKADLFVVVAYGNILSQEILNIPKVFCINVHGSLLPKYRGAAPINWAILNGDKETGVTVQKMALGLDTGDIISQVYIPIPESMCAQELRSKMAEAGAQLLSTTIDKIAHNDFILTPQETVASSYASKLTKEMGRLDWSKSANTIMNQIRGLKPWPGTFTSFKDKTLKVLLAELCQEDVHGNPGEIVQLEKTGFIVSCGQGALLITQVHPEASKPMSARSFVDGYHVKIHDQLL